MDAPEDQLHRMAVGHASPNWRKRCSGSNGPKMRGLHFRQDIMLKIVSASIRLLPSGHEFFLRGTTRFWRPDSKPVCISIMAVPAVTVARCKRKVVSGAVRKAA